MTKTIFMQHPGQITTHRDIKAYFFGPVALIVMLFLYLLLKPLLSYAEEKDDLLLFFEEKDLLVEAASRIKEPVSESPAIVNIITQKDIRAMGARNLLDVLYTLPGFFDIQDTNERVVALRGVYATTTHKILLLRDGHRLNDPLFENIMPENSISLASIKRIEVMRGPGASLYGNASLLGIINIVTVDDNEPSSISVGAGNFGQKTVDLIYNKPLAQGRQFLFFSSFADSTGERISLGADRDFSRNPQAGEQHIDRRPLNYDVGIKYKGAESLFALSTRRSSYKTPRGNLGQLLAQNDTLVDPQQDFYFTHLDLQYLPEWNNIRFNLRHYVDYSKVDTPQFSEVSRNAPPNGRAFNLELEDMRGGLEYSAAMDHKNGTAVVGFQVEAFKLLDSKIEASFVNSTTLATLATQPGLSEETEWVSAVYAQEKYNLRSNLILNGGLRYDHYKSFGGSLNPRLALIYNPAQRFFVKAVYAMAFQAPSYFYRKENQGLGYGAAGELKPEKMKTYQLSLENWFSETGWLRMTFFQNHLKDLISKPSGLNQYQNFGEMTTQGIETEAKAMLSSPATLFINHSYIRPVKGETAASLVKDNELINIPKNTVNGGVTWKYNALITGNLYASWHDSIKSPIGTTATTYRYDPDYEIPAGTTLNLAVSAQDVYQGVALSFKVHNLLDKRDWRGGTVRIPYPQEGRSIMIELRYSP